MFGFVIDLFFYSHFIVCRIKNRNICDYDNSIAKRSKRCPIWIDLTWQWQTMLRIFRHIQTFLCLIACSSLP